MSGWLPWRRRNKAKGNTMQDEPAERCSGECRDEPDPELVSARRRLAELERIADERTLAGLEWERDLQTRREHP